MTADTMDRSSSKLARITGALFLASLLVPMLNWILVNAKLIVPNQPPETLHRVLANGFLFRLGLFNDLLTSTIAIGLAIALYELLKTVHKPWARLALVLKSIEGGLMAVIALVNFAAFLVVADPGFPSSLELAQAKGIAGLFFNTRMTLAAFPMLFLGLNFTIFLSLLHKSKFVPRLLAGFGVLSYALVFLYASLTLLLPEVAANLIVQSVCWAPSCLFELLIGLLLLAKGIGIRRDFSVAENPAGPTAS